MKLAKRARAAFINGAGALYAPWRLTLALVAGPGVWLGARLLAGRVWDWLFTIWNLNARTLPHAPAWAADLVWLSPIISNTISCLLAFACSRWARAWITAKRTARVTKTALDAANSAARAVINTPPCTGTPSLSRANSNTRGALYALKTLGAGLALGALGALISLGICLLADSARIAPGVRAFSPAVFAALAERLAVCAFTAQFLRANVSRALGEGKLKYVALILSVCAQPVLGGALAGGMSIMRVINALAAAAIYILVMRVTGGIALETGAAFAFAAVSEVIFGFPSGGMLETYAVSEHWLTGGASGIAASPLVTLALAGAGFAIFKFLKSPKIKTIVLTK